jgi:hypothetical protein
LCTACDLDCAFFLYQPGLLDAFYRRARHDAPVHGIHHHRRAPSTGFAKVHEEVGMLPVQPPHEVRGGWQVGYLGCIRRYSDGSFFRYARICHIS